MKMPREKRLSSDGLALFNMSLTHPPPRNKIKRLLWCIFHTEYDDRIDEMIAQCRVSVEQLLAYTHHKDINITQLINNSIFNLIHTLLIDDGLLLRKLQVRQNCRYFFDVVERCVASEDHHSAIVILSALQHHSIAQFRFKKRKKDEKLLELLSKKYGTFRNCYKQHLQEAMTNTKYEKYLPCLMVLLMHYERHRAMSTIGRCNLVYEPDHIKSTIGMHAMHYYYPGEQMSLFNEPQIKSNAELILLAQSIKK